MLLCTSYILQGFICRIQEIVIHLRKGLQTQQKQKQRKCITIIEQLLANCPNIMNQAFNEQSFCQVLYNACLYLRKLKSRDRDQIREHACGIFLYWNGKFKGQERDKYYYGFCYDKLVDQNGQFPSIPYIKQVKQSTKNTSKSTSNIKKVQITSKNITQFLKDSQQLSQKTSQILSNPNNFSQINTNYVRLLKSKIQHIYSISTNAQIITSLSKQQKDKLSELYKKIRGQLKDIQKINQIRMKQQAIKKQQVFLQQKIEVISPKKSQKQIPKLQLTPTKVINSSKNDNQNNNNGNSNSNGSVKKQSNSVELIEDFIEQEITMKNTSSNKSNGKGQPDHNNNGQFIHDTDLLSMEIRPPSPIRPAKQPSTNTQPQQFVSKSYQNQPQFSTPKKSSTYSNNSQTESHGKFNRSNSQKQPNNNNNNNNNIDDSNNINELPQAQIRTPVKKRKQYEQLINLNQQSSSGGDGQGSQECEHEKGQNKMKTKSKKQQKKTINFKQLYAANQLSPELKDIDLSGKKLSKQSIKSSEEDGEFGEFA